MTDAPTSMTSHRPYLLRALWEWIADNGMTPHLLVDASKPGIRVPPHTVKEGRVVLNIADRAVAHLQMGNDTISFSARFGGVSQQVSVPVGAVLAIYARETGQGMALPDEIAGGAADPAHDADILDAAITEDAEIAAPSGPEASAPHLSLATDNPDVGDDGEHERGPPDGDDPTPPPRRGHLRVVK